MDKIHSLKRVAPKTLIQQFKKGLVSLLTEQGQRHRGGSRQYSKQREYRVYLNFFPASQLKTVVNGGHFKQSFAVGYFKVSSLNQYGKRFPNINRRRYDHCCLAA